LNSIDDGTIDRDLFVAKATSLITCPFALSRYKQLRTADFSEDLTTINPNELMMGAGGANDHN
jgi:hypothetical protein